jgi:hypothetical protein
MEASQFGDDVMARALSHVRVWHKADAGSANERQLSEG